MAVNGGLVDRVRLSGIVLFGHLGVHEAERETGQKIAIDVEMMADLEAAAVSDSLAQTIDYEKVYRLVEKTVADTRFRLIESLARAVAVSLLAAFPVQEVVVRVQKPNVPFAGTMSAVEVELRRTR
jgi:7,8-dihydroneopterin aldolase/epimerase/oxygenase